MIKDDTLINVRNRNNGTTGYTLADGAKETRLWAENEVKKITFAELKRVSYLPGGAELLRDYLVIEDPAAIEALNVGIDIQEQPEYLYTENEIRDLLFNGSLDELKDFLDFSPDGGIEIAKQIAVNEELPDMRKRKIISEATGFNINTAIEINDIQIFAEINENNYYPIDMSVQDRKIHIKNNEFIVGKKLYIGSKRQFISKSY